MAETYTDSTGKVFPVNAFGRPMGYFDGNTFVFPRFGNQPAVTPPSVNPVTPTQPVAPVRQPGMVVQPPQHEGDSQVPDEQDPYMGDPDGSLNLIGTGAGIGSGLGFFAGVPFGGGLIGAGVGAGMEKAIAQARAMRSFGIPGFFSARDALDNYRSNLSRNLGGLLGPSSGISTVGQFQNLAMEMANAPDGGMFSDEDAKDPTAAFTMADLQAMQDAAGGVAPPADPTTAFSDPFGAIANALAAGDAFGLGEDTMGGDTTADDGVGFDV